MTVATIFGLSSGRGPAGVAVVRVSGPAAHATIESLCGDCPKPRSASYRKLSNPLTGQVIDAGLVLWLPKPATFTGEDIAEFQIHGSSATVSSLLDVLGGLDGLRSAQAGEFTRQAFLNGKMDLVAVEGLADLVVAETDRQREQSLFAMTGGASAYYEAWRKRLVAQLAHLEAAIDFSDEADVERQAMAEVGTDLGKLASDISHRLDQPGRGELIRDGVTVVIAGAPNVGKSSLLNALARRDVAIVSPHAGTTRDAIEVRLDLAGLPVSLIDTAGLREAESGSIEAEGIARARDKVESAQIVLWMTAPDIDAGPSPEFDSEVIRIENKSDLRESKEPACGDVIRISVKDGSGIDRLLERLSASVAAMVATGEPQVITRQRHREALQRCRENIVAAAENCDKPLELRAEHLRIAANELGRIVGLVDVEDVLDVIFSEFCIGK